MLGLFLLFPLAFVFFSLITHICFSLFEPGFPRWLLPTPLFDVRASRQPPGKRVPLVFVPRSGRYGAGGMTWRHISPWSRVPLDRRLAPSIKIVIKGLGRGIPQPCSERLLSGVNRKSIMGDRMSPCSQQRSFAIVGEEAFIPRVVNKDS